MYHQEQFCKSDSWQNDIGAHLNAKFGVQFTPGAAPVKTADENRKNRIEKRRTQRSKQQQGSPSPAPPPPPIVLDAAEIKRQERLMRNRAAAQKSRDNKKQKLNELEAQMVRVADENQSLKERIAYLESLVQQLSSAHPVAAQNNALAFEECTEYDLTPSGTPGEMVTLSLDSSGDCNECYDVNSIVASPEAILESPSVSSPESVVADFGPFGEISDFLQQDEDNQPLQDELQLQSLQPQSRQFLQLSQKRQFSDLQSSQERLPSQQQQQQRLNCLQNGSSKSKGGRSVEKHLVSSSKSAVLDRSTSLPLEGTQCNSIAAVQLQVALTLLCLASSLSTGFQKSFVNPSTEASHQPTHSTTQLADGSADLSSTTLSPVPSPDSVISVSLRKARWKQAEQQCGVNLSSASFHPTQTTQTLLAIVC